jgi:predicted dehydrogenase
MSSEPIRVGIVGCGTISGYYFERLQSFDSIDVRACADLVPERAKEKTAKYDVARACSPEELLADPDIDLVVNLTIPAAHASVAMAAIAAGKSIYTEKPLALDRAEGEAIVAAAAAAGSASPVRVGCAPDTFLGAGLQTCRRLLDEGAIGEPLAATAFVMGPGPEVWHPNPAFLYEAGAGPLFDVGVYYLTALVNLLGPVQRVSGSARISRTERPIPVRGGTIKVSVPTHVAATLDFAEGPVATLIASFDVPGTTLPRIEVYGTEGTLAVPDPNTFGGPVRLLRAGQREWADVDLDPGFAEQARGIGVADMVRGLATGEPHRASGELALHVLDIMQAVHEASAESRYVSLTTTTPRPAAFDPQSLVS